MSKFNTKHQIAGNHQVGNTFLRMFNSYQCKLLEIMLLHETEDKGDESRNVERERNESMIGDQRAKKFLREKRSPIINYKRIFMQISTHNVTIGNFLQQ